ncbi:MAG: hypothetical protein M3Z31_17305 [Pseudomonadota bacterium]|nr:hypothetical protein [Pseudomonadota bacterium]
MNMAGQICLIAAGIALQTTAAAQRMEISSESIGTVVVTPSAIGAGSQRNTARVNPVGTGQRSGVDLGIVRRKDGTLYDALDPAQNPAAASAASPNAGNGSTPAGRAPQSAAAPVDAASGGLGSGDAGVSNPSSVPPGAAVGGATGSNAASSGAGDVSSNGGSNVTGSNGALNSGIAPPAGARSGGRAGPGR